MTNTDAKIMRGAGIDRALAILQLTDDVNRACEEAALFVGKKKIAKTLREIVRSLEHSS